jgi:hypothetical protein
LIKSNKIEVKVKIEKIYDSCMGENGKISEIEMVKMRQVEWVEDPGCESREDCSHSYVDYVVFLKTGENIKTRIHYKFIRTSYNKGQCLKIIIISQ